MLSLGVCVCRYNYKLLVFSGITLLCSLVLVSMSHVGAAGFIYANCVNMSLRIGANMFHVARYFSDFNRHRLLQRQKHTQEHTQPQVLNDPHSTPSVSASEPQKRHTHHTDHSERETIPHPLRAVFPSTTFILALLLVALVMCFAYVCSLSLSFTCLAKLISEDIVRNFFGF